MGNRLSSPQHPIALDGLLGSLTRKSLPPYVQREGPYVHANLFLAWRFSAGSVVESIALQNLASFDGDDAILLLRLYDPIILRARLLGPVLLSDQAAGICSSGLSCLNMQDITVPLNVIDRTLHIANRSMAIDYRVYVWSGKNASATIKAMADSHGFQLAFALRSSESQLEAIDKIWFSPSYCPLDDPPSNHDADFSMNPVFRSCCDLGDALSVPFSALIGNAKSQPKSTKSILMLNLHGIAREYPMSTQKTRTPASKPKLQCDTLIMSASMSEEQQKMALLDHFVFQSSLIEPNLFLSGQTVSRDLTHLKSRGITHIINAAADACQNMFPEKFKYLSLRMEDSKHEDIMCRIYDVIEFMEKAFHSPAHKVLVHCHRGISRSATLVIAYLMLKYQIPFNTAFELVKSRRDIINPNIGFSVAMIQWYSRLNPEINSPSVAYRITCFSPVRDPSCVVAKIVDMNGKIDSRGVFVFHTRQALFVWTGSSSQKLLHSYAIRTLIPRLQRYEKGHNNVIEINDGEETHGFLSHFTERQRDSFSDGYVLEFTADYQALKSTALRLPDDRNFRSSGASSYRFATETQRQMTMLSKSQHDEDLTEAKAMTSRGQEADQSDSMAANTTEPCGESNVPILYEWPSFTEIEVFGPEDLCDSKVFVFVEKKSDGRAVTIYVWAGIEVDVFPNIEQFCRMVGKECAERLSMQHLDVDVRCEEPGEESNDFWDLF